MKKQIWSFSREKCAEKFFYPNYFDQNQNNENQCCSGKNKSDNPNENFNPTSGTTVVAECMAVTVLDDSNGHNQRNSPASDMVNDREIPLHFNSRYELLFGEYSLLFEEVKKVENRKEMIKLTRKVLTFIMANQIDPEMRPAKVASPWNVHNGVAFPGKFF